MPLRLRRRLFRSPARGAQAKQSNQTTSRSHVGVGDVARMMEFLQGAVGNQAVIQLLRSSGASSGHRFRSGSGAASPIVRSFRQLTSRPGVPASAASYSVSQITHEVVQRVDGDVRDLTSPRFAGDPILEACLDDRFRLTKGAQGPSVQKVQAALIELGFKLGPTGADGMYGDFTWNAVKAFKKAQRLGFEHMGDVGPGTMGRLDEIFALKPPEPKPVNRDTEAALDATLIQYQFMLTRQRDALQAVRRDLSLLEKPKAPFVERLVRQFLESWVAFYFGAAQGLFKVIIDGALKKALSNDESARKVFEEANGKVFESLVGDPKMIVAESPEDPVEVLDAWFDTRLSDLTEKGLKLQLFFVKEIKPQLLNQPPAAAKAWEEGAAKAAAAAFAAGRKQELADWSTYQAQAKLDRTRKGGTKLTDAPEDTRGVLELEVVGGLAEKDFPVRIKSARITGLSERTRRQLAKREIKELTDMPVAARGDVDHRGATGRIEIGRNEKDEFFSWNKSPIGNFWLRFRAAARDKPSIQEVTPEDIEKARAEDGAMGVFGRDLDNVKLLDVPNGLQGPD